MTRQRYVKNCFIRHSILSVSLNDKGNVYFQNCQQLAKKTLSLSFANDTTGSSMLYNSLNFIVLFPCIFLLYYAIPARYGKARNVFLLVVSYLLYLQWKPAYALILLGVTAVTYGAARALSSAKEGTSFHDPAGQSHSRVPAARCRNSSPL